MSIFIGEEAEETQKKGDKPPHCNVIAALTLV
jgi:hypothetical protein